jgi:hypothetical protein
VRGPWGGGGQEESGVSKLSQSATNAKEKARGFLEGSEGHREGSF